MHWRLYQPLGTSLHTNSMKTILRSAIVTTVLGWIIWAYMALCNRTIRWTVEGDEQAKALWQDSHGIIVAAWHSTILLMPSGWNRLMRRWQKTNARAAMLISLSRDGEPVAKAIRHLGLSAVRGSSTHKRKQKDKGGAKALSEAMSLLRSGGALCITPDGPRGPAEKAQNGPVTMAQRTQAPILPYAVVSSPAHRLNTWDRFRVPYPFTRGAIVFGDPVLPDKTTDREALRMTLETALTEATDRATYLVQKKGRS